MLFLVICHIFRYFKGKEESKANEWMNDDSNYNNRLWRVDKEVFVKQPIYFNKIE